MLCTDTGADIGQGKSVLYLNLEEYAGFEELMQKKFLHTLSDLLYFVKQGSTGIAVKMNGMAESMGNVDFIPPVQSPEDIRGTSWQDWEHLLQEIILHSSYEMIVLDIGNGIEEVFQMLDMCTTVYTPIKTDKMSRSKLAQFEELLSVRDYPQILSRMVKLNLPYGQEVWQSRFAQSSWSGERLAILSENCSERMRYEQRNFSVTENASDGKTGSCKRTDR